MATISFRIDGDLLNGKSPSMRTLATVSSYFQVAISRAYLDEKYGTLRKYQKISRIDYDDVDFWFSETKEGSFFIDFLSRTYMGDKIADKLIDVLTPVYSIVSKGFDKDYFDKKTYVSVAEHQYLTQGEKGLNSFDELKKNPPKGVSLGYAEKAIAQNISKAIAPLRSAAINEAEINFDIKSQKNQGSYFFDKEIAFHLNRFTTSRTYYKPILYRGRIYEMDKSKNTAFFYNLDNLNIKQRLIFKDKSSFESIIHYFQIEEINFIGMPCIEAGSLDINAGDVLFVGVVK